VPLHATATFDEFIGDDFRVDDDEIDTAGAARCRRKQTMPAPESEAQSCMIGFGNVISLYATDKWISVGAVAIDGRSEEDTRSFRSDSGGSVTRVL